MGSSRDFADAIQYFCIHFPPFLFAIIFHEFGHGWMAARWGDRTAEQAGRLTLNPVAHIDPVGTLLFPAINMLTGIPLFIGWAKPVPINPTRFRKYRPGLFWVSAAGPGMNVVIATLSAFLAALFIRFVPRDFYLFDPLKGMLIASVMVNYSLAIFNLIPLPPLDGSKIVESILPLELSRRYENLAQYSFWILMALLLSGALSILSGPIQSATQLTLALAGALFL
jgi:Zn-dependent protease